MWDSGADSRSMYSGLGMLYISKAACKGWFAGTMGLLTLTDVVY